MPLCRYFLWCGCELLGHLELKKQTKPLRFQSSVGLGCPPLFGRHSELAQELAALRSLMLRVFRYQQAVVLCPLRPELLAGVGLSGSLGMGGKRWTYFRDGSCHCW